MFNLKINFKTEDASVIIKDLENFFTNFGIVQQPNQNIKTMNLFLNGTVPEQDLSFVPDLIQVENIWYTYFHNLIIENISTIEVINTELNKVIASTEGYEVFDIDYKIDIFNSTQRITILYRKEG